MEIITTEDSITGSDTAGAHLRAQMETDTRGILNTDYDMGKELCSITTVLNLKDFSRQMNQF